MKVALVTGSNKGIGLSIVEGLLQKLSSTDWKVYLTSRDEGRGQEAVKQLEAKGLKPSFHILDINDAAGCQKLADYLKSTYGGLDILVNNAGIAYKAAATEPFSEQAEVTVNNNFWGTLNVCDALFPIMRENGRVVNVSSRVSQLVLGKFSDEKLKMVLAGMPLDETKAMMKTFVESAKAGTHLEKGFPESAYGMSKVGMTLMGMAHASEFKAAGRKICVFNCCPGYVDTDMSSHKGPKTVEQGADTPLYLALDEDVAQHTGKFFGERKIVEWQPMDFQTAFAAAT